MGEKKPFRDERKRYRDFVPEQAKKRRRARYARLSRARTRMEKEYERERRELEKLREKVDEAEKMVEYLGSAASKTPAEQRKALLALFEKEGFDPFKEMIDLARSADTPMKDRVALTTKLAEMVHAKPKSVDLDARVSGGTQVQVVDFSNMTKAQLAEAQKAEGVVDVTENPSELPDDPDASVPSEDYDEFYTQEDLREVRQRRGESGGDG